LVAIPGLLERNEHATGSADEVELSKDRFLKEGQPDAGHTGGEELLLPLQFDL
jgi:hypothetical protein